LQEFIEMTDGRDSMSLPRTTGLGLGAPLAIIAAIVTLISVVIDGAAHNEAQPAKHQTVTFAAMASIASSTEPLCIIVPAAGASTVLLGDRAFRHKSEGGRNVSRRRLQERLWRRLQWAGQM